VLVQEKLDGSCTAVAKINGEIVPLGRAGYRAISSPFPMHHVFHGWVMAQWGVFNELLGEGERAVGEWLAQAHGTRYDLDGRQPWVLFDIMRGSERAVFDEVAARGQHELGFSIPATTTGPMSIEDAVAWLGPRGFYGAIDDIEGAVWRVERQGKVDFLVKYVRPDTVDGLYLDSQTGADPIWNVPVTDLVA
jgi:hypothetical protein